MSTVIIRGVGSIDPFDRLPRNTVRDNRLSYRSLGILVRLLSNADGYRMTSDDLARGDGREGRDAVRTALRELRNAGYIRQVRKQDAGGRWTTESYVFDTPTPEKPSPETDDGKPGVGFTSVGDSGAKNSKSKKNTQRPKKKKHPAVHAPIAPASLQAVPDFTPSATALVQGAGRRQWRLVAGIACWVVEDVNAVESLIAQYGEQAVSAAAEQALTDGSKIRAMRKRPYDVLPSDVATILAAQTGQQAAKQLYAKRQQAEEIRKQEEQRRQAAHDAALADMVRSKGLLSNDKLGSTPHQRAIDELARLGIHVSKKISR